MSFLKKKSSSRQSPGNLDVPRVLISRLSAHGDVAQTLPLLSAIKSHDARIHVGWVVEESAAPLLENHPLIDRLHLFRRKRWLADLKRPSQWGQVFGEFGAFVREMRQERYTVGFDVQGLLKSSLMLVLAGIPRRIGFYRTRENASVFYTETIPHHEMKNPVIPTVARFAEFAGRIGCEALPTWSDDAAGRRHWENVTFVVPPVSEAAEAEVQALLSPWKDAQAGKASGPIIALAPATIWPAKHWKEEYWETLLTRLLSEGYRCLLLGAPSERELCQRISQSAAGHPGLLNLAGQTDWLSLYALFRRVDILVGLDSAPLHITNAVGHPLIIGIYGPTGARRTGPVGEAHIALTTDLSCQPCFKRVCPLQTHACMEALTPDQVMEAVTHQVKRLEAGRLPA